MKVHPITIMVLLLLSSNIYGIIGMVVAIPVYSIGKEIVKFLVNLYDNHRVAKEQKKKEEFGITHYYDLAGNEIQLNQGKTCILIIDQNRKGKFQILE